MILKLADFRGFVHQDRWYDNYLKRWLSTDESSQNRQLVLGLLLPSALIALVVYWVQDWLFGIVGLGLNILILLYCFGRGDLSIQISSYLDKFKNKDAEAACNVALAAGLLNEDQVVESAPQMNQQVLSGLMYQEFLRLYLVFFWYLVLGVFGALFICLGLLFQCTHSEAKNSKHLIARFLAAAEWIPVRILAITFGLVGNFESVYQSYKKSSREYELDEKSMPAQLLLTTCGFAALGLAVDDSESEYPSESAQEGEGYIQLVEEVEDTKRMLFRSLVVWLAGLSILTIVGWSS
jgi:AmpE protein